MSFRAGPSNMWHLFDYYYQIGGSGAGAKKACAAPVHLLYAYPSQSSQAKNIETDGDGAVWAVNSRYQKSASGLVVAATRFDLNGTIVHAQNRTLTSPLAPDSVQRIFDVNLYPKRSSTNTRFVTVPRTDTREDQYQMRSCNSANDCCVACADASECTHR
jgi:hypothetical protein